MKSNIFPKNYEPLLDVTSTQEEIKYLKGAFEVRLAKELKLKRASAPLFVDPNTGLNDNLSGKENAVPFTLLDGTKLEIVQSLAKWKRYALKKYNLQGIYTDMNAIRPNEELDNLHSLYVDQWDWEKVISKEERNINFLKQTVDSIYKAICDTDFDLYHNHYTSLNHHLPEKVTFIDAEDLRQMYPDLNSKERENLFTKEHKAVFVIGIGKKLGDGSIHDSRAADYDDWNLNGDLLLWHDTLGIALEVSSMGIRVNKDSLKSQLEEKGENFKLKFDYHKQVLADELPLTIGGGIGQSRLCMFFLNKAHIGEVQSSYWSEEDIKEFEKYNVKLL